MEQLPSSIGTRAPASVRGRTNTLLSIEPGGLVASGDSDADYSVVVEILSSGGRDEATYQISLDNGATFQDEETIPEDGEVTVPDTGDLLILTFADESFVEGHLYSFDVTASVISAVTESGGAVGGIAVTGTPADDYEVIVEITTSGARGAGVFRYTLDNGGIYVSAITIPANGIYVLGASGLTITFEVADYVDNDTFSFDATAPTFDTALVEIEGESIETHTLHKVMQVTGTFTGAIDLEGSLDEVDWVSLGQLTVAGKVVNSEAWKYVRAHVTALEVGGDIAAVLSH